MSAAYPKGFSSWTLDERNAYFAAAAEAYVEKSRRPEHPSALETEGLEDALARAVPKWIAEPISELPVVSAASLADKPIPPRRSIVPDMIPDRTVTIVAGDGGDGKTTLKLQLAVAVAGARPWLGYNPEPAPVMFLSAEDDLDELHRRLASIAASLDVALAEFSDLHLIPLAGRDAVMGLPQGKTGIVTATSGFSGLVALVKRISPRLVVLDALADVFGGEENARAQARQFIGLLRGLAIDHNLAVALIAHPSLTGISSGSGTSGSTAWSNSVRSRLYLERVKGDDGREFDADLRVLSVKKANYGPAGVELRLRWRNGSFILDGPAGGFDKLAAEAKAEHVFLDPTQRVHSPRPRRVGQTEPHLCTGYLRLAPRRLGPAKGPPRGGYRTPFDGRSHPRRQLRAALETALTPRHSAPEGGRPMRLPTPFQPASDALPTPSNGVFLPTPYTPGALEPPVGRRGQRRGLRQRPGAVLVEDWGHFAERGWKSPANRPRRGRKILPGSPARPTATQLTRESSRAFGGTSESSEIKKGQRE
jgi:hypothetical protein